MALSRLLIIGLLSIMLFRPPTSANDSVSGLRDDVLRGRFLRRHRFGRRPGCRAVLLSVAALLLTPGAFGRGPEPAQRIPLAPFGFQTLSSRYLLEGASMVTVDYVDEGHLLVTFGISRLMPRLPDCPPDDADRIVKAVLIELPSGRELAHTEWRFHDLGQYLWNLGDGHFLLRQRDTLTSFAPLQHITGEPFALEPFLQFDRRIQAILVSANHDLLSIETVKYTPSPKPKHEPDPQTQSPDPAAGLSSSATQADAHPPGLRRRDPNEPKPDTTPVEITFIRLVHDYGPHGSGFVDDIIAGDPISKRPSHISARFDGRIHTAKPVTIPLTSDGFLRSKAESKDGVLLDFLTFDGRDLELGDFATSCPPRPTFISHSEFVTFGCRGSEDSLDLAGFNLHGDLIWQINFSDDQAYPSIVSAVPAGRFAFSRTITTTHVYGSETPSNSQLTAQEVRVIQMYNGKQLLRVTTSPIQRAGQNFTLSPDGLSLATIHDTVTFHGGSESHNTGVEIYKLPELSSKDQSQIKAEAAMAPEPSLAAMRFSVDEIKSALSSKSSQGSKPTQTTAESAQSVPSDQNGVEKAKEVSADRKAMAADGNQPLSIIPAADPAPACAGLKDTSPGACPVAANRKSASETEAQGSDAQGTADQNADGQIEHRRKPPSLYEPAPPASGAQSPE